MAVQLPTMEQLRAVARRCGLSLDDADLSSFRALLEDPIRDYNDVAAMADELPPVRHPRTPGYRPRPEDNKHNAWYRKTSVKGSGNGKLQGKRVVLKDNIMLAGVPMMNGASTLEGYVPEFDATVVTRILDAGGEIIGKAHCEFLCISGGSHTNATGPVHNPYRMGYSAGGSSSGCAVLVATGEADMAIGGDQGGSIRIPSAFCGIYGMKPTWGLVPYTGIMPIEIFVDHTGPMTKSVTDNAVLLEVIAGDDGYDSRIKAPKVHPYSRVLGDEVKDLRIAVVKEGFDRSGSEEAVDKKVSAAANRFAGMGARVEEVSIPMQLIAPAIWTPIVVDGLTQTLLYGDGFGASRDDLYPASLMDFHRGWRQRADELSETTKLVLLLGTYVRDHYGPRYYAKAVNIVRRLRAAYDEVLSSWDLLLMPTTQMKPTPLPEPTATREEYIARAFELSTNTLPFNLTRHPAMSLPCGLVDGLPVGLMLVGRQFDEPTIYRAAYAFEQSTDWREV
jgi:amidase